MKRLLMTLSVLALVAAACGPASVVDAGPVTTRPPIDAPDTTPSTVATSSPGIGSGSTSTTTTTAPVSERVVDVFLIRDAAYAVAIPRNVPDTPAVAHSAIRALLAGPTVSEVEEGLTSAIPEDTLLLGIVIEGGIATVDLSREFEAGGGSFAMLSRLAQIVYTLTQFPTVDAVQFHLDGEPVTVFSGEGIVLEDPVARVDYVSLLPLAPIPDGPAPRWEQGDLPNVSGIPASQLRQVVEVAEDDVLNVRSGPGVDSPIIGMLAPDTVVQTTGNEAPVGSSQWAEIRTPNGFGWVNERFLGPAT